MTDPTTTPEQTPKAEPKRRTKVKKPQKVKAPRVERNFPRVGLERALSVAKALKDKNQGNPYSPDDVAKVIGISAKTPTFFYLTAASRDYGLTEGTSQALKISLTDKGRATVYAPSPQAEAEAKLKAFLDVESFRKVLNHYKGNSLPEKEYLSNTLANDFKIPTAVHDEFIKLFQENCKFLGIGANFVEPDGNFAQSDVGETKDAAQTPQIITHSKPLKGKGPLCFVIMPFVERQEAHPKGFFKEVLQSLIVPACSELGFVVRSANREGSDVIQSTIVNDLLQADLVVADLTEHNPNVLFELGMRMAEDKPVALIRAKGTGKIFDVDNMLRVFDYDACLWPSTINEDLPNIKSHIKATWDNRTTDVSYMKLLRKTQSQAS